MREHQHIDIRQQHVASARAACNNSSTQMTPVNERLPPLPESTNPNDLMDVDMHATPPAASVVDAAASSSNRTSTHKSTLLLLYLSVLLLLCCCNFNCSII